MLTELPACTARWRRGELSDAVYAALYFLHWQWALHRARCASRKSKQAARPQPRSWLDAIPDTPAANLEIYLLDWLGNYQFRGIIPNVTIALCAWLRNEWDLRLYEHIPTPTEVLVMQTQGWRPVTVLSDFPRLLQPVLNKANGYAFMVHDLEHAWKFHHDPQLRQGQKTFFVRLLAAVERGLFGPYLDDTLFAEKFDYLMSDMNTHPAHSQQYLRAILIEQRLRQEGKAGDQTLSTAAWQEILSLLATAGLSDERVREMVCPI